MTNERVLPSPTPPGIDKSQISCVSVYVTCVVVLAPLAGSRLAWSQRPHDRPRACPSETCYVQIHFLGAMGVRGHRRARVELAESRIGLG